MLRFHLLPPEHRVVVTPTAVKKATGIYYERVYGGGETHAVVWDGARLPSSMYMFFTVLLPPRVSHVLHPAARSRRRG